MNKLRTRIALAVGLSLPIVTLVVDTASAAGRASGRA